MTFRSMDAPRDEFGILAAGSYLPRLRLDRASVSASHRWMAPGLKSLARGSRSMANWDEDVVTMAVEACRAALGTPTLTIAPQALSLASLSMPFADRLNAGIVRSALGLSTSVQAADTGGSLRAGTTELLRALRADTGTSTLVVAADQRQAKPASTSELLFGDGAAALLVGTGKPLAVLKGSATQTHDFVDHFRETGRDTSYGWEERWIRDAGVSQIVPPVISQALDDAGWTAQDVDYFVMPAQLPKLNEAMARKLGVRTETVCDTLFSVCGDTGTAHPALMLAEVLNRAGPDKKILLVQFGSGCDALALQTTAAQQPGTEKDWHDGASIETNYLKFLSFNGQIDLEWGMRAEMDNKTALSAAWRNEPMVQGFVGGKCSACGTVQFPSARVCVNPACASTDTQQPYRLADEAASIHSYTCDWLSYRQSPPFQFGHVAFDCGARVLMEFTDSDPDGLAVGCPLTMVFRIKDIDPARGFRRYFWKARPQGHAKKVEN